MQRIWKLIYCFELHKKIWDDRTKLQKIRQDYNTQIIGHVMMALQNRIQI